MQCITRFPLSLGISALTLVKRPGHSRSFGEGLIKDEQKAEIKNRQGAKNNKRKTMPTSCCLVTSGEDVRWAIGGLAAPAW